MVNELQRKRIAFVITPEGAEQVDLVSELYEVVKNAGGTSELLMTDALEKGAYDHLCEQLLGRKLRNPRSVSTENASDYHGLVVPGIANAGPSQMDQDVASFVIEFVKWGVLRLEELPGSRDGLWDTLSKIRKPHIAG
jgi:protease I